MADTKTGIVLNVNNTDYDAISCSYFFNQGTTSSGQPNGSVQGGQIQLSFLSEDNSDLAQWMGNQKQNYDGTVTFYTPDDLTKVMNSKKVEFTKGCCVAYSESFSSGPSGSFSITISADTIKIGGNDMVDNKWSE